jgi:hypothetical protein
MGNKNNFDFKSVHISGIAALVEGLKKGKLEPLESPNMKFSILTHSALITADLFDFEVPEGVEINKEHLLRILVKEANNSVNKQVSEPGIITARPIYLKNAVIRSFSNFEFKVHAEFLCVYSDQVVGITLGDGPSEPN